MESNVQLLDQTKRRRIYDYVCARPGLHLRRLERELEMPLGTLEYHLHRLQRAGLLVVRRLGRCKAYFAEGSMDRRDKDFFYFLRQEMPRRISLEIVDQPGLKFAELCSRLPIAHSTVSFHLQRLVRAGIVQDVRVGREKAYTCVEPERVRRLISEYRPTFTDDVVDRFAAAWMELEAHGPGALPGMNAGPGPVEAPA